MNPDLIQSLLLAAQAAKSVADACLIAAQQMQQQQPGRMISAAEAMELLDIGRTTLHQFRRTHWTEGVHYFKQGQKGCIYNADLLADWNQNRGNEVAHQAAIERWLRSQNGKQKRS